MPAKKPSARKRPSRRKPARKVPVVSTNVEHLPSGRIKGAAARHVAFARELFAHGDGKLAYLRIYYPTGNPPGPKVIETSVLKLKKHRNVQAELQRLADLHAAELAAKAAAAEEAERQTIANSIATRDEILRFHTRIMRTHGGVFRQEDADLCAITETRRLPPPKFDREGNEIPHPDADEAGYITEQTRRTPDLKERIKAAAELAELQGLKKVDLGKPTIDAFATMLSGIRGGGLVEQKS